MSCSDYMTATFWCKGEEVSWYEGKQYACTTKCFLSVSQMSTAHEAMHAPPTQ
jgi:hypothetical protein